MNLGMAVVARRNTIGCLGGQDLVGLGLAIGPPLFLETRLEESATAATAKIIGFVGCHVYEIFFAHNFLDNISHFFGNRVTQRFSDQLTGILERKLDLTFLVPV